MKIPTQAYSHLLSSNIQNGGIVIKGEFNRETAFIYFARNSVFEVLSTTTRGGILFRLHLEDGVDSPYFTIRSNYPNKEVRSVIVKLVSINAMNIPDYGIRTNPIFEQDFVKEVRMQKDIYLKSLDEQLEPICPSIVYNCLCNKARILNLLDLMIAKNNCNVRLNNNCRTILSISQYLKHREAIETPILQKILDDELEKEFNEEVEQQKQNYGEKFIKQKNQEKSIKKKQLLAKYPTDTDDKFGILVMENLEGYEILDASRSTFKFHYAFYELHRLFLLGYIHGDAHQGNIMINPNYTYFGEKYKGQSLKGRAIIIDFGKTFEHKIDVTQYINFDNASSVAYALLNTPTPRYVISARFPTRSILEEAIKARIKDNYYRFGWISTYLDTSLNDNIKILHTCRINTEGEFLKLINSNNPNIRKIKQDSLEIHKAIIDAEENLTPSEVLMESSRYAKQDEDLTIHDSQKLLEGYSVSNIQARLMHHLGVPKQIDPIQKQLNNLIPSISRRPDKTVRIQKIREFLMLNDSINTQLSNFDQIYNKLSSTYKERMRNLLNDNLNKSNEIIGYYSNPKIVVTNNHHINRILGEIKINEKNINLIVKPIRHRGGTKDTNIFAKFDPTHLFTTEYINTFIKSERKNIPVTTFDSNPFYVSSSIISKPSHILPIHKSKKQHLNVTRKSFNKRNTHAITTKYRRSGNKTFNRTRKFGRLPFHSAISVR